MEREIQYKDIILIVHGKYIPKEKEVSYYNDMSGSPSSASCFEIDGVFIMDIKIDNLLSYEDFTDIEKLVIDSIEY